MKRNIMFGTMAFLAGSLLAANAAPKDDVSAAAKKLSGAGNYSWKSTVDMGPNAPFTPGPTEGKTEKDGFTWLSTSFNDNTSVGVMKGAKIAVKTDAGWQTAEEAGGGDGGFNPATMVVRRLQSLKVPAAEVEDLVSKTSDLKKDGDVYSGDLTEDGAKSLLSFGGGRRGGAAAAPTGAKGSVKIWVKDGTLTKYEIKVQGKVSFGGNDMDMDRTTTTEIKDVGATKLDVPDDAKKKLS